MNPIKIILIALLIVWTWTLNSCDIFDSHKHLTGRYYLNHTKFGKCICYKVDERDDYIELIDGAFGLIGFDGNYIIVQRSEYQYLILPIYKKITYSPEKGILGPFNLRDFNKEKQKLNIKAGFTINTN